MDDCAKSGIDDPSVPKEMQRIGEAFYGRAQAYRSALGSDRDEALVAALSRNVYGGSVPQAAAPVRLAAYIRKAVRVLRHSHRPTFWRVSCEWRTRSVNVPVES
jgi:cytochrome b pre-mRNA-processing protein 3